MLGNLKIVILTICGKKIYGNCDTKLSLGTTDTLTAQYFCDLVGVSTVETESIKKSNSIEGDINEYGQKNISTLKRNLLNVDEILRIPSSKLLVILRGNKPLLLDKVMYKEHPLAKELKDSSIYEYKPKWTKNDSTLDKNIKPKINNTKKEKKKEKLSFDTF